MVTSHTLNLILLAPSSLAASSCRCPASSSAFWSSVRRDWAIDGGDSNPEAPRRRVRLLDYRDAQDDTGEYCSTSVRAMLCTEMARPASGWCRLKLNRYFTKEKGMMQHIGSRYFPQIWNQDYWTSRRTKQHNVNSPCTQITTPHNPTC